MNWKINIGGLFLLILVAGCNSNSEVVENTTGLNYVVDVTELKTLMGQENIKLIDFRKKHQYNKGHIPGALNLWRSDIENPDHDTAGMMATPAQMEALLGSLGISPSDTIVVYDDNALCDAARFWWVMQNYHHMQVFMLNGGLTSWKDSGGKMTAESPVIRQTEYSITNKEPSKKYYITHDEMLEAVANNAVVIDARSTDEYSGKRQKKGAARAGRIPGSINSDWAHSVNYESDKHFKKLEELEAIYSKLEIEKDTPIIVYCHSGVRSAHLTFVLTQLLGYTNVRNYDGSWTAWSAAESLPLEQDNQ